MKDRPGEVETVVLTGEVKSNLGESLRVDRPPTGSTGVSRDWVDLRSTGWVIVQDPMGAREEDEEEKGGPVTTTPETRAGCPHTGLWMGVKLMSG